ncbi:MAG: hypothetical protein U0165_17465, partial [Polyangiaceae bacterium]
MKRASLFRDSAVSMARHLIGASAGILTLAIVARALGVNGLASWALVGTSAFMVGLADLGLSSTVQRAVASGEIAEQKVALQRAVTLTAIASPILAVALMAITHHELSKAVDAPAMLLPSVILAGLAGVVGSVVQPLRSLLVTRGQLAPVALSRSVASIAQVIVLLAALYVSRTLIAPSLALLVSSVLEIVIVWSAVQNDLGGWRPLPSLSLVRGSAPALKQGAGTLVLNAAVLAALRIDVTLLANVAPLATVAAYGVASRAVDQAFTVVKQIGVALLSRLARSGEREQAALTALRWMPSLVAAVMASLCFTAQPWFELWVGPGVLLPVFTQTLLLLGLASVLAATSETACSLLTMASSSTWNATRAVMFGSIVNVVISVGGLSQYGALAVAGGTLIGNMVSSTIAWRGASRLLGWSLSDLVRAMFPAATIALGSFNLA